jgi:hypothetical protein
MPLIECPDCTGKVSDKAPACPHCGCLASDFIKVAPVLKTESSSHEADKCLAEPANGQARSIVSDAGSLVFVILTVMAGWQFLIWHLEGEEPSRLAGQKSLNLESPYLCNMCDSPATWLVGMEGTITFVVDGIDQGRENINTMGAKLANREPNVCDAHWNSYYSTVKDQKKKLKASIPYLWDDLSFVVEDLGTEILLKKLESSK